MSTYRLFPATSGPSAPTHYAGNFKAGVMFKVTTGGMWFEGYYHWVPAGGDTVARVFALWAITGNKAGSLVSAATTTSGTLTAGQWNFVPLATPIPLAIGTAYNACTGWVAVNGFPDSDTSGGGTGAVDSFGTGGHTTGITQGPLFAFSDQPGNGTAGEPYGTPQGLFSSTTGSDPTASMPTSTSNSANFWMDVQVSDTAPSGYSGSYRLWPNKADANSVTTMDSSASYDVATEFALSEACALNRIWYYSIPGVAQMGTVANIWSVTGSGLTGTLVASATPSWSGASGWVSTSFTGVTLPAGKYKVSVLNGAATPGTCFAKDANTDYWRAGAGAAGITFGPLSAPNLSGASTSHTFSASTPGSTPPFTDGTTQLGQPTFSQGLPDVYPSLFAPVASPTAGSTQNYWVDVEVTPVNGVTGVTAALALSATPGTPSGGLGAVVQGITAGITLAAPGGLVAFGARVLGVSAPVGLAAVPGVVLGSASASVPGVTASLMLVAHPGLAGQVVSPALDSLRLGGTAVASRLAGFILGSNMEDKSGSGYGGWVT